MYYLIGLGNYKDEYIGTRHNIGRDFLIWFAEQNNFSEFEFDKYSNNLISRGSFQNQDFEIILPQVFMNNSGDSLAKYIKNKNLDLSDFQNNLIIFQDDLDMNFGDVKITKGKSGSGGHNGIKSIFDHLKTEELKRVKIGIIPKTIFSGYKKPKRDKISDFVLNKFGILEKGKLDEIYKKIQSKILD